MAYKFQLGDAVISGSLTAKQGSVQASGSLVDIALRDNAGIRRFDVDYQGTNVRMRLKNAGGATKLILGEARISGSGDLETKGALIVGGQQYGINANGAVTGSSSNFTTISGSSTLEVGGNTFLAGTVKLTGVADTALAVASDSFYFLDGDGLMKRDTMADYATAIAGGGIAASSGVLSVDLNELSAGAIASGDSFAFVDANDSNANKKETVDDLATLFAGDGLSAASAVLAVAVSGAVHVASDKVSISGSVAGNGLGYTGGVDSISGLKVNVDDTGIEINADSLRLKDSGVTAAKLNDDVISGQTELNQGALAAADELMISDGGTLKKFGADSLAKDLLALTTEAAIADGDYLMFLDGSGTGETKKEALADVATLFAGDGLTAASSVLAVQVSGAVKIASDKVGLTGSIAGDGLGYSGGVDSISELVVLVDDSSIEINSDSLRVKAAGVTDAMLNDDVATGLAGVGLSAASGVMAIDLNELSAAAVDVSADSIAIIDANDSNNSKKESIADLVSAMAGAGLTATNGVLSTDAGATPTGVGDANATLTEGTTYGTTTFTADRTWSLPAAPDAGDMVRVKAPPSLGGFELVIAKQGSHTIDGQGTISLQSNGAAVTLIYVAANLWKIV